MKRWFIGAGVFIAMLALALGGIYWRFESLFNTAAPTAEAREGANPLEQQRADLDQFERLVGMDRAFSAEASNAARARIAALRKNDVVLHPARFRMELQAIAALADNAHSQLFGAEGVRPTLIPIRTYGFSDGVHVLRADSANADLLGARVTHIDGRPVGDVMASLARFYGGPEAWRRSFAYSLLNQPERLYGAGLVEDPARTTWRFALNDQTLERTFTARQLAEGEEQPATSRLISTEPIEHQTQDFQAFTPSGPARLAFTDFSVRFRRKWLDDNCTLFLQFKANRDEDGYSIGQFMRETRQAMHARRPCNLILDMRFNGGGDYTLTAGFFSGLPALVAPRGRIYVLTGVNTFSAGITSTAFVEQAAPDRVVILGEEVGDRLAFWSEGNRGCLPHAKLCYRFTRARHDYGAPCTDWNTCFWLNYIFPVRVRSLAPDETIALSFADYSAGRDPVLERAIALAGAD